MNAFFKDDTKSNADSRQNIFNLKKLCKNKTRMNTDQTNSHGFINEKSVGIN